MIYNQTNTKSVLALLRGLVPRRALGYQEALRVTELQAARLLSAFSVETLATPDEVVTELPRIRVVRERGLPVSGAAHWNGRYWLITLNADDHPLRQRFSLMHEFKHILDHTVSGYLYHDRGSMRADEQAERVADYFAACVLMPKLVMTRLWCRGEQKIELLSRKLRVSTVAIRYRLDQLGLTEPQARRCTIPKANRFNRRTASLAGVGE